MARATLTDERRAAKKKAAWDKIKAGRPNPSGRKGTEQVWAGIADSILSEWFPGIVFQKPEGTREQQMLARLGLKTRPGTLAELRKAFGDSSKATHPDLGGSAAAFRDVVEAWGELKTFY